MLGTPLIEYAMCLQWDSKVRAVLVRFYLIVKAYQAKDYQILKKLNYDIFPKYSYLILNIFLDENDPKNHTYSLHETVLNKNSKPILFNMMKRVIHLVNYSI